MSDILIKLLKEAPNLNTLYNEEEEWRNVSDHLIANGVIVPTCKMGSDIYHITDSTMQEMQVAYGVFSKKGITMSANCKDEYFECESNCDFEGKTCGIGFDERDIGKTVFLTKEDAKKALAERIKNADL